MEGFFCKRGRQKVWGGGWRVEVFGKRCQRHDIIPVLHNSRPGGQARGNKL